VSAHHMVAVPPWTRDGAQAGNELLACAQTAFDAVQGSSMDYEGDAGHCLNLLLLPLTARPDIDVKSHAHAQHGACVTWSELLDQRPSHCLI
jgi:hypothetical protein